MEAVFMPMLLFTLGLFILIKGGDTFVDAAVWISDVTGIPKLIIGATVISIATTLPELFVSVLATADGSLGIATGNAIGSVTANIGVGMSIGLIACPAAVNLKDFAPKACIMLLAAVALLRLGIDGRISVYDGFMLMAVLAAYIYSNVKSGQRAHTNSSTEHMPVTFPELAQNTAKFVLGACGIVLGASMLVTNGQILAYALGVSEDIIGLTLIAVGTSLPELITAATAIAKNESALTVGNIIGANIIDTALILPVCSMVSGGSLAISARTVYIDLPAAILLMLLVLLPTIENKAFKKWQGVAILSFYVVYVLFIVMFT